MRLLIKRIAKWEIIALISVLVTMGYVLFSWFPGIPVLNYHQINNEAHNVLTLSASEFETQIAYLYKAGYHAITPDQLIEYLQYGKKLPSNPILITLDDGYEDNYRVAYPILQKYHFTATVFLITDFVGNNSRYLNWKQVKEMHNNGFIFESHTSNHIVLPSLSDEKVYSQLIKSKKTLEDHLDQEVKYLAYPAGYYDQRIIDLVKQSGYRAAFTINFGRDTSHCELFTLNRIPIFEGAHTFFHFWLRLKFTQAFSALQNLRTLLQKNGATFLARLIYIP